MSDAAIVALRGERNTPDVYRAYGSFIEEERTRDGDVEPHGVILITNRECPYKCVMCDLWKNTTVDPVPPGAVAAQVETAIADWPECRHVKLYNAGSFFDRRAVSPQDHDRIVAAVAGMQTVLVEAHPKIVNDDALAFNERLGGTLEVAMGLETVDPRVLPALNKKMTLDDFDQATRLLRANDIPVRAFILVRPPWQSEPEGLHWACRSLDHAFGAGVDCCTLIPTRAGNGAMERLAEEGQFAPPALRTVEAAFEYGLRLGAGRVFVDLWDIERVPACTMCRDRRIERLRRMNLTQSRMPAIDCPACADA